MKYVIEIPSKADFVTAYYMEDGLPVMYKSDRIDDLEPYTEPDRKDIEDEVWDFASMLMNMHPDVAEDIYWSMNGGKGIGVAAEMSYQEAKAKYEAWKKEKDDIHVGDEIYCDGDYEKAVVMEIHVDGSVSVYTKNGCIEHWWNKMHNLKKTGRHFDEVAELLKKMRGREE